MQYPETPSSPEQAYRLTANGLDLLKEMSKKDHAVTSTTPFLFPTNSNYWSSTEYSTSNAWYVNFGSGYVSNLSKYITTGVVRPVAVFRFTL